MSDHKFFRNFGYKPPKIITTMPEEMQHNLFIMEIYNNWDYVKKLVKDHKEGNLANRKLDALDQYWLSILIQNNINLEDFENADDFHNKLIK